MQDLIKRIEAATGPCRALDAEIANSVGIFRRLDRLGEYLYPDGSSNGLMAYTSSIDAAMTLVGEGYFWTVGRCDLTCHATVGPDRAHFDEDYLIKHQPHDVDIPNPSTAALALCAAALGARQ